jgi:hypothetical protein
VSGLVWLARQLVDKRAKRAGNEEGTEVGLEGEEEKASRGVKMLAVRLGTRKREREREREAEEQMATGCMKWATGSPHAREL